MKRTILLIFIALMTAIGCQAQEADATKTTRYNNRHTMDGYKAFYETGYFIGLKNQDDYRHKVVDARKFHRIKKPRRPQIT